MRRNNGLGELYVRGSHFSQNRRAVGHPKFCLTSQYWKSFSSSACATLPHNAAEAQASESVSSIADRASAAIHPSEAGATTDAASNCPRAGSSSYHFARLFLAYTGETPFDFLRRIRLATALRMLQEDPDGAVTEIALSVGYETPSAFNKVFKKILQMSPREFRNLGKESQHEVIYRLIKQRVRKEITMNLTKNFEIVTRPATHYVFLEKHGPFAEVAPPTWDEMHSLVAVQIPQQQVKEFLGLSGIDRSKMGEDSMIYQAGVAVTDAPKTPMKGLQYRRIESGKYARFLLIGPYAHIAPAFDQVFKTLAEKNVTLREEYCIENYLNDPKVTPEDQLQTELLIPAAA